MSCLPRRTKLTLGGLVLTISLVNVSLAEGADYTQRLSATFQGAFDDSGIGEDYLTYSSALFPVRFAAYSVYKWNGTGWDIPTARHGFLTSSGETELITFTRGVLYRFVVRTYFAQSSTAQTKIYVQQIDTSDANRCKTSYSEDGYENYYQDFYYPTTGTKVTTNFYGNSWNKNNAIIAGWIIDRNQTTPQYLGLPFNTNFFIYPTTGATQFDGACTNGYGVRIRNDTAAGVDHSRRKFMVAHELGHAVGYVAGDIINSNYSRYSSNSHCNCDSMGNGDDHCLHSYEYIRAAEFEGFAHFFSSLVWNAPSAANGVFGYYKTTWKYASGAFSQCTTTPCVRQLNVYDRWWRDHCEEGVDDRGTEMDWLKFFWSLRAVNSLTPTTMFEIWSNLPNSTAYAWEWDRPGATPLQGVRQAADVELGSTDLLAFSNRGVEAGVDNP